MNTAQKRKIAVGIFVAVAIVFSLIGCHRSLSERCRQVEEVFFAEDILSPGNQLNECVKLTNRILSVINGNLDDSLYDSLAEARQALDEALEEQDISQAAQCAQALDTVVAQVQTASKGKSFDSTEDLTQLFSDYEGARRVADDSGYNDTVDEFMKSTANRFPTNILRRLSFVTMPERFE